MSSNRNNYRHLSRPGHPIADKNGQVLEHRLVLYEKLDGLPAPCAYCSTPLTWEKHPAPRWGLPWRGHLLEVDHVDGDSRHNAPENLVPCCRICNIRRSRFNGAQRGLQLTPALRVLAVAILLALGLGRASAARAYPTQAHVTHYWWTGRPMSNGDWPYYGAVASNAFPLYTWIETPDGALWQVLDRCGGCGDASWIDFYGFVAEDYYGSETSIEVW